MSLEPEAKAGDDALARVAGAAGQRAADLWARLGRATLDNPVLVKEFRTRMRGTRSYWMLLGYTLLLAGVLAMMYFAYETSTASQADTLYGNLNTQGARDLGRQIYYFVFIAQAIMVALITPAITAGTVSIEREQRCFELLVTTPLRPVDVIRGKLAAAVSFVVLLLTASLPLVSISFLVGGVSPAEIFFSYLLVALGAFVYGSIGIFWSATLRTTAAATVVTYLTVLSLFILTMTPGMTAQGAGMAGGGTGSMPEIPFQSFNPLTATLRAVHPEYLFQAQMPSWISGAILNFLLGMLIANAAMARLEHFLPPPPHWMRLCATLLWAAFCLFLFGPIMGGVVRGWTGVQPVREGLALFLGVVLVLTALFAPVYNTGDLIIRRGESALGRYLGGFLPFRMFGNDLSCGFPLILAWLLFFLALLPIGAFLTGKAALFNQSGVFLPGAVLCVSVVLGLSGVGHFLSVTLPSRWAACILTYLTGLVVMVLPYFSLLPWYNLTTKPKAVQPLWQVLYLVPFEGLSQLGNPSNHFANRPALLFGDAVPIWLVTSVLYLALGALCLVITAARIHKVGSEIQEKMEAREKALQGTPA